MRGWAAAVIAGAFFWLGAALGSAGAQSLAGLQIGDAAKRLEKFGAAVAAAPDGEFLNQKWTLTNGNDLAVSTTTDGHLVYLEFDWGGKDDDPGCDLPGLKFGATTLADLRKRFGSDGFGFQNRSSALEVRDGLVMMNSYEVGTNVVTFITKVSQLDYATAKAAGDKRDLAGEAKLDAIMISDKDYALTQWGNRVYDLDYKKIEWK
jgi:hypothetical protein